MVSPEESTSGHLPGVYSLFTLSKPRSISILNEELVFLEWTNSISSVLLCVDACQGPAMSVSNLRPAPPWPSTHLQGHAPSSKHHKWMTAILNIKGSRITAIITEMSHEITQSCCLFPRLLCHETVIEMKVWWTPRQFYTSKMAETTLLRLYFKRSKDN